MGERNWDLDGREWLAGGRFVGLTEIAEMLGVSKQRASQLSASKAFPAPLERLAMGPVWRRTAVEKWAEKHR